MAPEAEPLWTGGPLGIRLGVLAPVAVREVPDNVV
jgi:hypothetical protein